MTARFLTILVCCALVSCSGTIGQVRDASERSGVWRARGEALPPPDSTQFPAAQPETPLPESPGPDAEPAPPVKKPGAEEASQTFVCAPGPKRPES